MYDCLLCFLGVIRTNNTEVRGSNLSLDCFGGLVGSRSSRLCGCRGFRLWTGSLCLMLKINSKLHFPALHTSRRFNRFREGAGLVNNNNNQTLLYLTKPTLRGTAASDNLSLFGETKNKKKIVCPSKT